MAKPKLLRGTYVNILIGNGAGPEVFTPLCGARTKAFNHTIETQDDYTRDCADPTDIPTRDVTATGERWDIPFTAVLNRSQLAVLQAAQGLYKNYRFELAQPTGDLVYGGYYAGQGFMSGLTITGDDGTNATVTGTILSNGEWTFTVVP